MHFADKRQGIVDHSFKGYTLKSHQILDTSCYGKHSKIASSNSAPFILKFYLRIHFTFTKPFTKLNVKSIQQKRSTNVEPALEHVPVILPKKRTKRHIIERRFFYKHKHKLVYLSTIHVMALFFAFFQLKSNIGPIDCSSQVGINEEKKERK